MKIGLGTAQVGMDYGISNRSGRITSSEALGILTLAESAGVRVIDTAAAYGDAEERLGSILSKDHPFSIVTKLPRLPRDVPPSGTAGWVLDTFEASRQRLRATSVHGLLVHDANDLLDPRGAQLWAALEELRGAARVRSIGVSVYAAEEIDAVLERYRPDLVQVPLNVLDQRLVRSGHLARLKRAGIEIHSRSSFLQGLLLMDPAELPDPYFDPVRGALEAFHSAARAAGRSPLQAAVAYVASVEDVDTAVFGVTSGTQLAEILAAATCTLPPAWFAPFARDDERILNPSLWPR
jgi:aryl-alcohol dehydrogenase-like predicted oxidoreductase